MKRQLTPKEMKDRLYNLSSGEFKLVVESLVEIRGLLEKPATVSRKVSVGHTELGIIISELQNIQQHLANYPIEEDVPEGIVPFG